jgi:hypothetical protein
VNRALVDLVEQLRARRELSARAEEIEGALLAVQNDDHPNAVEMFDGLVWIARQRGRSLDEKLLAIGKLINHPGGRISLRKLTGW